MTSKGEPLSRGTNWRLPFDVNVMLNLYESKLSYLTATSTKGHKNVNKRNRENQTIT